MLSESKDHINSKNIRENEDEEKQKRSINSSDNHHSNLNGKGFSHTNFIKSNSSASSRSSTAEGSHQINFPNSNILGNEFLE